MAVLKIFPDKDATLYSLFPNMNTGLDEIVEATETVFAYSDPNPQTSRFLIHFADEDLAAAIDLIPQSLFNSGSTTSTGSWNAKLQCFIATATGLAVTTSVDCFPLAQYWDMGTGRYLDEPISTDGCSWIWAGYSGSTVWQTSNPPSGASSSYTSSVPAGGGVWYTGSQYTSSVIFSYRTNKDLNLDVTNTIKAWTTSSGTIPTTIIDNYGFILKQRLEFVDNKNYQPELKYFSVDTNTIYPPALQISWNDFSFNTGSNNTQTILNTLPATITLAQNPGVFYSESINRFRINARPEYPIQIWQTSSVYLNNYYLPTASYWALKDLETNEYIVDFDYTYTKLSADATSSYFDLYMNFLQPERYYAILIQSTINGSTVVFNDQYYFKVING
jgi:hypothetical protein